MDPDPHWRLSAPEPACLHPESTVSDTGLEAPSYLIE
ncbi:MAG: hypothetical protein K0S77_3492 [Pseudomonas sp.]|nr:hypothetical protein [Pseudomonas sp.]